MKLKTLAENTNGNGTKSPEQVMTAALAAIEVRGSYIKAAEPQSTKSDVLAALWGIGVVAGDPSVSFMHGKMKDPAIQNRALQICDWVRKYQFNAQDSGGDFLRNAQSIMNKPDITPQQIGFIVGVIPGYERNVGKANKSGGLIVRAWPPEWGEVKMLWKAPVVVDSTQQMHNNSGSYQAVNLVMSDKYMFTWYLSDGATLPRKHQKLTVTGYLERNTRQGNIRFVADRKWAKKTKKELNIGETTSGSGDDEEIKD